MAKLLHEVITGLFSTFGQYQALFILFVVSVLNLGTDSGLAVNIQTVNWY